MLSTSKVPTLTTALAVILLIVGLAIMVTAVYYDVTNDLGTDTEMERAFFLGLGCFITSYLIAPTPKRHHQ